MSYQLVKAGINLYAILKNLEDLIDLDAECREMIAGKKIKIEFIVRKGPRAWVKFENSSCTTGQGKSGGANVILWFTSPEHLNKMFEGAANPIPLRGFTRLGFMQNEFTKITDKLAYYLKPEKVKNPGEAYIKINTRFTLTVAAFALSEIAKYDKKAKITSNHIPDGTIQLRVLPDGPAVYLLVKKGRINAVKGFIEKPDAIMEMKDYQKANDFLNGKSNPFLAIAMGDVIIRGQTPMLDNLSLILDKVNNYIS